MLLRKLVCVGFVLLIVTLGSPSSAWSQGFRGIGAQIGLGGSLPVGNAGFRSAFGNGFVANTAVLYGWYGWLRSWLDIETHAFDYDRQRFFDRIGIPNVDLSQQLGAGSTTWSIMAGADLTPWRIGPLIPYLRTGFGYYNRDNGAAPILIHMYCTPGMEISSDYLGPDRDFVAPEFCPEANRETELTVMHVRAGMIFHR